jgi:hypothetical protein
MLANEFGDGSWRPACEISDRTGDRYCFVGGSYLFVFDPGHSLMLPVAMGDCVPPFGFFRET